MNDSNDNINITDLIYYVIKGVKHISLIAIFVTAIFLLYFFFLSDSKYTSNAVLQKTIYTPESQASPSPLSSIAKLGGISLGGDLNRTNEKIIVKRIQTRDFFNMLVKKNQNYLENIYATESYNKHTKAIIHKSKLYDNDLKKLKEDISYQDVHEKFLDDFSIKYNLDDGLIYMAYEHPSPHFAKEMLVSITNLYNQEYTEKSLKESDEAINFLMDELSNTSDPILKTNIASLVQFHYQQKVYANIKDAISYIEVPYTPDNRSSPGLIFYLMLGILIGIIIGTIFVLYNSEDLRNKFNN